MLSAPTVEKQMAMPDHVARALRSLAETGLPAGAPESLDALAAVWTMGFLSGQKQEARDQRARLDRLTADVPLFLKRQA